MKAGLLCKKYHMSDTSEILNNKDYSNRRNKSYNNNESE
jgi:hypothetical protein